jgi:hypothetical protein
MSIKRIRILGKEARDVNDLTKTKFRSLDEVKEYLGQVFKNVQDAFKILQRYETLFASARFRLTAAGEFTFKVNTDGSKTKPAAGDNTVVPKVDKVIIPNLDELKSNFDVVETLHDKLELLDGLLEQVGVNFRGDPQFKAMESSIKKMKATIAMKIKSALTMMNKLAKKHEPTAFKKVVELIIGKTLASFKGQFKSKKEVVYVTSEDTEYGTTLLFTHYLDMGGFTDDDQYTHSNFYIVFTSKVDNTGNVLYFVTVLPKFSIPGKFNPGQVFTDLKTGIHALSVQLELENFSGLLEALPIPIKQLDITNFSAKAFIKEHKIAGDSIVFDLLPKVKTKEQRDGVITAIMADLRGLLLPLIKANLKYHPQKLSKNWRITFRLTLPDPSLIKEYRADQHTLSLLQQRLGLTEDDIRKLLKFLNR